jgi:hypothetical protein
VKVAHHFTLVVGPALFYASVPERSEVVCQVFGVEFFTGEV